jgi:hypothetical protein
LVAVGISMAVESTTETVVAGVPVEVAMNVQVGVGGWDVPAVRVAVGEDGSTGVAVRLGVGVCVLATVAVGLFLTTPAAHGEKWSVTTAILFCAESCSAGTTSHAPSR